MFKLDSHASESLQGCHTNSKLPDSHCCLAVACKLMSIFIFIVAVIVSKNVQCPMFIFYCSIICRIECCSEFYRYFQKESLCNRGKRIVLWNEILHNISILVYSQ